MRMGRMEQKEKREQDQWHQLAFHSKHAPEPHAPAVEWPPIMAPWTRKDVGLKSGVPFSHLCRALT
ncbi:unnamed protein product [Symbiodinium sp. CCMP2592]|nr:unnamed protein product [Symbiodinium sp. CCMP2592]